MNARHLALCALALGCDATADGGSSPTPDASTATDATRPRDTGTPSRDVPVVPADAPLPMPSCAAAPGGGRESTMPPRQTLALSGLDGDAWLASPGVADLDGDGRPEVIVARERVVAVYGADGTMRWRANAGSGRVWASPVVADLDNDGRLDVAVASGNAVAAFNAQGQPLRGFPVRWQEELRALAAGDLDGDGRVELVAASTTTLRASGQRDLLMAWRGDGSAMPGWPPNTSGASGCDDHCDVTGGFDQNLAIGPLDDDTSMDVLAPMDNAYISWHHGSGEAFRAASIFRGVTRVPGVRFLHDYAEAMQGYSEHEDSSDQAHFTNTAPAIVDLDGDGRREIVALASVQNASQSDRERGVALWALHNDGTRLAGWETPFAVRPYLAGLNDLGDNIVGATNQVAVADLQSESAGPEVVFAGFDGRVWCVGADRSGRWSTVYTTDPTVLTAGAVIADLTGDGRPEVIFATYSRASGGAALYVLDARGMIQQRVALPGRGSMAVPAVADFDGDGSLEVLVSLKDTTARGEGVLVFTVPGSSTDCAPWPMGRGNLLRNGTPTG